MDYQQLTPGELAHLIDHTQLKPDAKQESIVTICEEALKYDFGAVCIAPIWVSLVRKRLQGSGIKIACVIGFPHGNTLPQVKAFEAKEAVANGANELDMVINVGALKSGDKNLVLQDIGGVIKVARQTNDIIVKVILEMGYLSLDEKKLACSIARQAGADFIKTSTGFAGEGKGAHVEDIRLMRECVGDAMGIKAAGGIRDSKTALAMIGAGATRLGCSSSIKIFEQYKIEYLSRLNE